MSVNCNNKKAEVFIPAQGTWAELYKILLELLDRRHYLMPYAKEFNLIDDALKKYFEGAPNCSIGSYKISGAPALTRDIMPFATDEKDFKRARPWRVDIKKEDKNKLNKN